MLFKLSNLNSNLALTLGYLNPALNNSALLVFCFWKPTWRVVVSGNSFDHLCLGRTRPYLFQLQLYDWKKKWMWIRLSVSLMVNLSTWLSRIYPESNMHAIKKKLSKSKQYYEFVFSVYMFILGSSLKRLRNYIEGLQQMFLSNNFPIDVIQSKIAMTRLN